MSVLEVRAGVAFKRSHGVHVEVIVVNPALSDQSSIHVNREIHFGSPLAAHVLDHYTADAQDVRSGLRVRDLGVLLRILLHGLVHVIRAIPEDVVQAKCVIRVSEWPRSIELFNDLQLNSSLSSAHSQNQSKVDVLTLLGDVLVSQEVDNLEQLLKMKVLLTGYNVDHLVVVVLLVLQAGVGQQITNHVNSKTL